MNRFEDVTSHAGSQTRAPDLYLQAGLPSTISNRGSTVFVPISVLVDSSGTPYIGNEDFEVTRFDDALSLFGTPATEASAYLATGSTGYPNGGTMKFVPRN